MHEAEVDECVHEVINMEVEDPNTTIDLWELKLVEGVPDLTNFGKEHRNISMKISE